MWVGEKWVGNSTRLRSRSEVGGCTEPGWYEQNRVANMPGGTGSGAEAGRRGHVTV